MSTPSTRPVVVGYDGTPAGDAALDWAVRESDTRGLPLRVIVATDPYGAMGALGAGYPWPDDIGEELVEMAREQVAALPGEHDIVVDSDVGGPARVLVEESVEAELVVVGRRHHTVLGEFVGGSTSVQVAAHATCPVVIVEEGQQTVTDGPVVVGLDGSTANDVAVAYAFERAARLAVPVVPVMAWSVDLPGTFEAAHLSQAVLSDIEAQQRALLAERVAQWQQQFPEVTVNPVLRRDLTVPAIISKAKDAQLIVVGSRGHGGFMGLLLGSVSQGLIHHERPCPLAVIHGEPPAR